MEDTLCSPPRPCRTVEEVSFVGIDEECPSTARTVQSVLWTPTYHSSMCKDTSCHPSRLSPPLLKYSPYRQGHDSISLEGQMIDSALDHVMSLPAVVGDVMELEKRQKQELEHTLQAIERVKKEKNEVSKTYLRLEEDHTFDSRKLELLETTCIQERRFVEDMREKIFTAVSRKEDLKLQIKLLEMDSERQAETFLEYEGKMNRAISQKAEPQTPKQSMDCLGRQGIKIDDKLHSDELQGWERELMKALANKTREEQVKITEAQIEDEHQKQTLIQQETRTLKNRNAARLTRLKKQITVYRTRNRQLDEQIASISNEAQMWERKLAIDIS